MSEITVRKAPGALNRIKTIAETISPILGMVISLTTFLADHNQWVHDLQTLRWFSVVGYVLLAFGVGWIAFFDPNVRMEWQKASLAVFAVVTGLYFLWVGTWIVPPAREPWIIDEINGISMWSFNDDGKGSHIQHSLVDGDRHGKAMLADFYLIKDGYVAISRDLNPQMLVGSHGIGFVFKSTGKPNTIELKLIYAANADGKEAIFSTAWDQITGEKGWTVLQEPYNHFTCWAGTGCKVGESFDISKIGRIDISVSNKAVDEPGAGSVWIDEILAFP